MDMSENVIEQLDYTLCTYPFDLQIEYEKYIEDAFIKKKGVFNFSKNIHYLKSRGFFSSKSYEEISEFQFNMDLDTHEHIVWKGMRKKNYLPAAFTFAYRILCGFSKEYPEYILVALIQAQLITYPAPEPIRTTDPGSRVSFYFYSPCADGAKDLYWYKNSPPYCKKSMYWRFSTFDIPLLSWMITKTKHENREIKNTKRRERSKTKNISNYI